MLEIVIDCSCYELVRAFLNIISYRYWKIATKDNPQQSSIVVNGCLAYSLLTEKIEHNSNCDCCKTIKAIKKQQATQQTAESDSDQNEEELTVSKIFCDPKYNNIKLYLCQLDEFVDKCRNTKHWRSSTQDRLNQNEETIDQIMKNLMSEYNKLIGANGTTFTINNNDNENDNNNVVLVRINKEKLENEIIKFRSYNEDTGKYNAQIIDTILGSRHGCRISSALVNENIKLLVAKFGYKSNKVKPKMGLKNKKNKCNKTKKKSKKSNYTSKTKTKVKTKTSNKDKSKTKNKSKSNKTCNSKIKNKTHKDKPSNNYKDKKKTGNTNKSKRTGKKDKKYQHDDEHSNDNKYSNSGQDRNHGKNSDGGNTSKRKSDSDSDGTDDIDIDINPLFETVDCICCGKYFILDKLSNI